MANKTKGLEKVVEPSQQEIKAAVQHLKDWIAKEPHLPKTCDEEFLTTFFYNNKFSLEKTKFKLENFWSLKNKYPHLLKNRDPDAPGMEAFWSMVGSCENLTQDGGRLYYLSWDPDPSKFDIDNYIRWVSMLLDMLCLEKDRIVSYVFIIDLKNFQYQHFLKVTAGIKTASELFNKIYTERVEVIHLVNASSIVDLLLKSFLPLFPKKYSERVFVHTATKNSIKEMIEEDALIRDIGGKGPSYAESGEWTLKKLRQYKKWFKEEGSIATVEGLRRRTDSQPEEMKGSFRTLECD